MQDIVIIKTKQKQSRLYFADGIYIGSFKSI